MIAQEVSLSTVPDRIIMLVNDMGVESAEMLAQAAVETARSRMPKVTGYMASTLTPVWSNNHWGIYFPDRRTWFLERGTQPFTMNSLAGKTIPMWINDPDGEERKQNPKAKTRLTADGRVQVLIFRRAANKGERKLQRDKRGRIVSKPRSYPGAPGRIVSRSSGGDIAQGNIGVRWRNPGITGRMFLNSSMADTAIEWGLDLMPLYLVDSGTYPTLVAGR